MSIFELSVLQITTGHIISGIAAWIAYDRQDLAFFITKRTNVTTMISSLTSTFTTYCFLLPWGHNCHYFFKKSYFKIKGTILKIT